MRKVAIIGSGIAGMASAWRLRDTCEITFFEQENEVGGHTCTACVGQTQIPIDTGFMVYNEVMYPGLAQLFRDLTVPTQETSLSFSVQNREIGLEFSGSGFEGFWAQKSNLLSWRHWKLAADYMRFGREAEEVLVQPALWRGVTLNNYLERKGFTRSFAENYLIPVTSAIWSTPVRSMGNFPIVALVRFLRNHGLLRRNSASKWRCVTGGATQYRDRLMKALPNATVHLNRGCQRIVRQDRNTVMVTDSEGVLTPFDAVIIAAHADQALKLIDHKEVLAHGVLSAFTYTPNTILIHTDERVMPESKKAWASWNFVREADGNTSTVFWANRLQNIPAQTNYFISLNDSGRVDPSVILWRRNFDHPCFTQVAIDAQQRLPELNQLGQIYYCGSYFGGGFHEDALQSGYSAVDQLLKHWGI
jgi:predicted NAD/FAD-binding protein